MKKDAILAKKARESQMGMTDILKEGLIRHNG